jgi:hypothetical protein
VTAMTQPVPHGDGGEPRTPDPGDETKGPVSLDATLHELDEWLVRKQEEALATPLGIDAASEYRAARWGAFDEVREEIARMLEDPWAPHRGKPENMLRLLAGDR